LAVFSTRTEKDGFTGFFKRGGEILGKIGARTGVISLILSVAVVWSGGETSLMKNSRRNTGLTTTVIIHLIFYDSWKIWQSAH
jgi:hypothetical protein